MAGSALSEGHPLRGTCKVAHYSDDVKHEDVMRIHPEDSARERAGDMAAKDEREACAQLCRELAELCRNAYRHAADDPLRRADPRYEGMSEAAENLAKAIRARGEEVRNE